jgi:pSer/pThr/pTyr-binding forkhead associated (FHA) protein
MSEQSSALAKITWDDPQTGEHREYVLLAGATATIGRSADNQIHIPERHVSRQHAVISFRDGVFMLTDLGSANGTFVNDKRLSDPFPLAHGDVIRLYVPVLHFSAIVSEQEKERARLTGTLIVPVSGSGQPTLHITSGPQEGAVIPLLTPRVTIGRATRGATWDISLQDRAVSRPHCALALAEGNMWTIQDLGSANGTLVNGIPVGADEAQPLADGAVITIGETTLLFRLGG